MKTLKTLWLIYSVLGIMLILIIMFVPETAILNHTPACYSVKQFGKECFMCGSTRSFIQAGTGNFTKAITLNKTAFILFTLISINTLIFTASLLIKFKRRYV